jgi:RNA ligase (TIGR02306 family)
MVDFKVIKSHVEIFPHNNADTLELLKIDNYQCVVQKGKYKVGDVVVFAPEKSVLPPKLCEPFITYLKGEHKNRVGSIRLRGELSMGVILPLELVDPEGVLPFDIDLSTYLNISKWEPPIPAYLSGITVKSKDLQYKTQHDCEQFSLFAGAFEEDEPVLITEKLHGSQCILIQHSDNSNQISSKGLFKNNTCLDDTDKNAYWQGAKNSKVFEHLNKVFPNKELVAFGELVPVQKGFKYGCNEPTIYIFRIVVEGVELSLEEINKSLPSLKTVPVLYNNYSFNKKNILNLGKILKQTVLDTHIAEGIVVSPMQPRYYKNSNLFLKVISNKYAKVEDADAIS